MPMRAVPASPMMVRTSAKSTLISPGLDGSVGKGESVRSEVKKVVTREEKRGDGETRREKRG